MYLAKASTPNRPPSRSFMNGACSASVCRSWLAVRMAEEKRDVDNAASRAGPAVTRTTGGRRVADRASAMNLG